MPNGVRPSPTGGGITRAAELVFQALESSRTRALQARRLDIDEQIAAINQFTTLSNFLPPGSTLGDAGTGGMEIFRNAFGIDPEGLEGLELNPETLQTVLDARAREILDTEEGKALGLPAVRAQLGLEPNQDVEDLRGLNARLQTEALSDILGNPELMREFTERTLGRDPITLRIPGVPGELQFDSPTAASIYSQFLLARERFSFELDLKDEAGLSGLIEEVQKAVAAAGQSVGSPAIQGKIFPLYNRAAQSGDLTEITAFLNDPRVSQGEKLALQHMLGSIGIGENVVLNQLPPAMRNFLIVGQTIRDILGPEAAAKVLPSITEQLDPSQFGQFNRGFFGGLSFEIPGAGSVGEVRERARLGVSAGADPPFRAADVPLNIRTQTAVRVLTDRSMSREDLVATVGDDAVTAAEAEIGPGVVTPEGIPPGGIDPATISSPSDARDAQRLNNLLRRLETTKGELARKNLERVINSLRDRITARIGV